MRIGMEVSMFAAVFLLAVGGLPFSVGRHSDTHYRGSIEDLYQVLNTSKMWLYKQTYISEEECVSWHKVSLSWETYEFYRDYSKSHRLSRTRFTGRLEMQDGNGASLIVRKPNENNSTFRLLLLEWEHKEHCGVFVHMNDKGEKTLRKCELYVWDQTVANYPSQCEALYNKYCTDQTEEKTVYSPKCQLEQGC